MSDYSLILDHPDKDQILMKLYTGSSPKDINQWLRVKYRDDKNNRALIISVKLLQEFFENHADLYQRVATDIAEQRAGKTKKTVSKSLASDKVYQDVIKDIASQELDFRKEFMELISILKFRIEQVFDRIQEDPRFIKNADYVLNKHIEQLGMLYEKMNKVVNQAPDQIIQHNISYQLMDQTSALFQDAIRETLVELGQPEVSIKFIELLSSKMEKLKPPRPENPKHLHLGIKNDIDTLKEKLDNSALLLDANFEQTSLST